METDPERDVEQDEHTGAPGSEGGERDVEQDEHTGTPGSEGGEGSPASDDLPAEPSDDDSALGDTDQHSNA